MSLITNITKWVKGWRLDKFFKGFVDGDKQAAENLQMTVEKASLLVEKIKGYLKSPTGDIITSVIPGDWDNELRAKAIAFLEKLTKNSATAYGCFDKTKTVGQQLSCVYEKIVALKDEDEVKSFWHKMGVMFTKAFADGKLTFSDSVFAIELVYDAIRSKRK